MFPGASAGRRQHNVIPDDFLALPHNLPPAQRRYYFNEAALTWTRGIQAFPPCSWCDQPRVLCLMPFEFCVLGTRDSQHCANVTYWIGGSHRIIEQLQYPYRSDLKYAVQFERLLAVFESYERARRILERQEQGLLDPETTMRYAVQRTTEESLIRALSWRFRDIVRWARKGLEEPEGFWEKFLQRWGEEKMEALKARVEAGSMEQTALFAR